MSYYRNKLTINEEEYILYGYEGPICIWQVKNKTQSKAREYYAYVNSPLTAHTVGEIREKI